MTFSGRLLWNSASLVSMGLAPASTSRWQAENARAVVLENWNEPVSETIAQ